MAGLSRERGGIATGIDFKEIHPLIACTNRNRAAEIIGSTGLDRPSSHLFD
jgi:hypothetical protein